MRVRVHAWSTNAAPSVTPTTPKRDYGGRPPRHGQHRELVPSRNASDVLWQSFDDIGFRFVRREAATGQGQGRRPAETLRWDPIHVAQVRKLRLSRTQFFFPTVSSAISPVHRPRSRGRPRRLAAPRPIIRSRPPPPNLLPWLEPEVKTLASPSNPKT